MGVGVELLMVKRRVVVKEPTKVLDRPSGSHVDRPTKVAGSATAHRVKPGCPAVQALPSVAVSMTTSHKPTAIAYGPLSTAEFGGAVSSAGG